jgi:hypothetical protein
MHAVKLDIQRSLRQAQTWLQYEGVVEITSSHTPSGDSIVVLTNCNPAAITAPIPSYFQGFTVIFCQTAP